MSKVVDLRTYKTRTLEQRVFGSWNKRFGEGFDSNTRLSDLSGRTLLMLATPDEKSTTAFYELVMGALDLGTAVKFPYLDTEIKMQVVDIHLFMADHTRFELMRRLGWLTDFCCRRRTLLEMVHNSAKLKNRCRCTPPALADLHPGHTDYLHLTTRDKESFVRRMLPEALEAFKTHLTE